MSTLRKCEMCGKIGEESAGWHHITRSIWIGADEYHRDILIPGWTEEKDICSAACLRKLADKLEKGK